MILSCGPVAQLGLRRRPSEPDNVGSNPSGPVITIDDLPLPNLKKVLTMMASYEFEAFCSVFWNIS